MALIFPKLSNLLSLEVICLKLCLLEKENPVNLGFQHVAGFQRLRFQESCTTQQRAAVSRICFMKRHVRLKSIAPKWSQEKQLKKMKIDQAIYYIDMIKFMIQLLENGAGNFLPSPTASFAYQANVRFCA